MRQVRGEGCLMRLSRCLSALRREKKHASTHATAIEFASIHLVFLEFEIGYV